MKSSYSYLRNKLEMAVADLATGEGDSRSRVGVAFYRFWHIPLEDFPKGLRRDRKRIDHLLTRLGGREGYIIPENLRRMKNKTASMIALLILELYLRLRRDVVRD